MISSAMFSRVPVFVVAPVIEAQLCVQSHWASPGDCMKVSRREAAGQRWGGRIVERTCFLHLALPDKDWRCRTEVRNSETRTAVGESDTKVDYKLYEALMRGGEEVSEMMKDMTVLLEDIAGFEKDEEEAAVRMAAAGVVGQKLHKLEGNFLMALDWMIQRTEKEKDAKKKRVLDLIKETVLAQLSNEAPSQVQVVSALCTTSCKDARQEILRRCACGGGIFKTERGGEIKLPGANLNDVANQADDILTEMEEKPLLQDRRLLAKLLLVREEARSLLSGGIFDERNDNKGLKNLADEEVSFLSKLVALKPGPQARERLARVLRGKDEGEEKPVEDKNSQPRSRRRFINVKTDGNKKDEVSSEERSRPVRPGMFLETITKLLAGMYGNHTATGVTVQQLEWIHRKTLDILQEIAYS